VHSSNSSSQSKMLQKPLQETSLWGFNRLRFIYNPTIRRVLTYVFRRVYQLNVTCKDCIKIQMSALSSFRSIISSSFSLTALRKHVTGLVRL
jgi:hypothetical protein